MRKRVFVVDDDYAIAALLRTTFEMRGHEVASERDVLAAKKRLETEPFDLIVLDLNLQHGTGLDLVDYIRQTLQLDTPVVILSAMRQEATIIRSLEMGANNYFVKPFNPAEIMKKAEEYLMD